MTVTRTGGLLGRTVTQTLETDGHPDGPRLAALAGTVLAAPAPAGEPPGSGVPDGYRYAITDGERTVTCTDGRLTAAQRELIRAVLPPG